MIPICLVFRAHEPYRLRRYNYFDVGRRHDYFDAAAMHRRLARSEQLSYEPATRMLERLLERHPRFAFSLALSGPLLEQLSVLVPSRLTAFRRLVETGRVEALCATSHHCLPWAVSSSELEEQIRIHRQQIHRALGRVPAVFGGEDPSDAGVLGALAESIGLSGMLLDGSGALASGPARRRLYRPPSPAGLPVMVRDDELSDGIERRFSDRRSAQSPLTAEKFDGWISATPGDILCLSMDLETFGLRHPAEGGIFDFFQTWVARALSRPDSHFLTPSEAFEKLSPAESLPRGATVAGTANEMQQDALSTLASLEGRVKAEGGTLCVDDFRRLTGSEHFRAMSLSTGDAARGETGAFDSPYEAYMAFRHAVSDLERRLPRPRPERALSVGPTRA